MFVVLDLLCLLICNSINWTVVPECLWLLIKIALEIKPWKKSPVGWLHWHSHMSARRKNILSLGDSRMDEALGNSRVEKKLKSEVGANFTAEFYGLWMLLVNITIWYWYIIFWNLWFMDVYTGLCLRTENRSRKTRVFEYLDFGVGWGGVGWGGC